MFAAKSSKIPEKGIDKGDQRAEWLMSIDEQLLPILQSLQIDADNWLHAVEQYGRLFYRVSGRLDNIASSARKAGRKWFCGLSASIGAFRPVESTA
ncbi:MAG: hypothetical protein EOL87_15150 [Spartobacteria bacterium]|nr:hypothetical protein [Spartobacteria bacterium]